MRKRSRYRPKPVLVSPLNYVIEGMKPIRLHDSYLLDLKIKNHGAMSNLTKGVATRKDMDMLISMVNVGEALYRLGFGEDYKDVVDDGLNALHEVAKRGDKTNRFVVKAEEMNDLNTAISLCDAQLDLVTIKDMERAMRLVEKEFLLKKMRPITERET